MGDQDAKTKGSQLEVESGMLRRWVKCVEDATSPRRLYYRPTSLFEERYWMPHYPLTMQANELVQSGKLSVEEFEFRLWMRDPMMMMEKEEDGFPLNCGR